MDQPIPDTSQKFNRDKKIKEVGLYGLNMLSRRLYLSIDEIGKNVFPLIQQKLKRVYEGKCTKEGYIKKNSVKLTTISAGHIIENSICYNVLFECLVCCPVEGMNINNCIVKNITKAGIRATINDENENPLTIFIARDHHFDKKQFSALDVDGIINVKVIGQRFELNDNTISIIASLIEDNKKTKMILRTVK
jgi:DNA-directed RNA polymerase subunit E'/Rpb7